MSEGGRDLDNAPWRTVQAVLLILAGAFFLYSMRSALNPFLLYCVVIALLTPFRGVRGNALLMTVATILVCLWILSTAGSLLAPFFLAFVLAYILDPVADRIEAHPRIGRTAAIFLILIPFLALGAVVLIVGVPELVAQARSLDRGGAALPGGTHCLGAGTHRHLHRIRHPLRRRSGRIGTDPGARRAGRHRLPGVPPRAADRTGLGGRPRSRPRFRLPPHGARLPGPSPPCSCSTCCATTTASWRARATSYPGKLRPRVTSFAPRLRRPPLPLPARTGLGVPDHGGHHLAGPPCHRLPLRLSPRRHGRGARRDPLHGRGGVARARHHPRAWSVKA